MPNRPPESRATYAARRPLERVAVKPTTVVPACEIETTGSLRRSKSRGHDRGRLAEPVAGIAHERAQRVDAVDAEAHDDRTGALAAARGARALGERRAAW